MLGRVLGDTIELRLELGEDAGCVLADSTEIEQVVMNLAVNARDAMPKGGVITIATETVHVEAEAAGFEAVAPGDYVSIRVRDTGEGIDSTILHQIFEPFFSTKLEVGGTGLGLAIVYAVVTQHGGHVRVQSHPHQGTEFTLLFPGSTGSVAPRAATAAVTVEGGTETILVMEDSAEMRRMLSTVLRSLGYTVLAAEDGQRGVEVAHEYQHEIHLILSDIAMPRLSGPEAVEQIRRERPGVRVLLLTGFADSKLHEDKPAANISILEKPVAPELLAAKIRETLRPGKKGTA
jgi:two-component system, cell cycle sensor histidine kinase and response regulator CckA